MMNYLLDTHTFLWWVLNDSQLSARVSQIIRDSNNQIYLSAVVGWEISIKAQLGKMDLPDDPKPFIQKQIEVNDFVILPITMAHAVHVYTLPLHHRDPFDRLLIAQSQLEKMPLLSNDGLFEDYAVTVIWR